mmetsp:Transcript_34634/g.108773  ORF Transcript_34634/g.108773 Transcript_34634/m.108773 type:complete len:248 (-) Transcript_34634:578-1321(-)
MPQPAGLRRGRRPRRRPGPRGDCAAARGRQAQAAGALGEGRRGQVDRRGQPRLRPRHPGRAGRAPRRRRARAVAAVAGAAAARLVAAPAGRADAAPRAGRGRRRAAHVVRVCGQGRFERGGAGGGDARPDGGQDSRADALGDRLGRARLPSRRPPARHGRRAHHALADVRPVRGGARDDAAAPLDGGRAQRRRHAARARRADDLTRREHGSLYRRHRPDAPALWRLAARGGEAACGSPRERHLPPPD